MSLVPAASPLLSILIPVYNAEKYLGSLLTMFVEAQRKNPGLFDRVEIIVANNVSEDTTQQVAESFIPQLPMLRALSLTPHYPTAEENIFRSFSHCNGTYTWALGSDDLPNFECFSRIIQLLAGEEFDFYLFNYAVVSPNLAIRRTSNFLMNDYLSPTTIVELTQRFGFWFVIAGISGQILRTECVRAYDITGLINQTSRIYAHVTSYLECFADKRMVIVNEPIVFYRVSYNDVGHWQRTAAKLNVFDEYFWTLGYIRQLEYLEAQKVIPTDYLRFMLETNEFRFFRPIYVIADKLRAQLTLMAKTTEARNHLTTTEFNQISDFLFRKDPFMREFVWQAKAIYQKLLAGAIVLPAEWNGLQKYFEEYSNDYLFASLLVGNSGNYEIYRIANSHYAIHHQLRPVLEQRLRHLNAKTDAPALFIAESIEEVREKVMDFEANATEAERAVLQKLIAAAPVARPHVSQQKITLAGTLDYIRVHGLRHTIQRARARFGL